MLNIKRIISVAISIVLLLTFVGCSKPQNADDSNSAASSKVTSSKSSTTSRLSSYQFVQNTKVKIMPLGDSLTQGGQHNTSAYRGFLSTMLSEGGHNTVFVGSHKWSFNSIKDGNWMHSGYGGATVESLSKSLGEMTECDADIVLLMIGRNNTRETSAEDIVKQIDELLVTKLFEMYPGVHIFLANPPPCRVYNGGETLNNGDIALNKYLPAYRQYVEDKKAQGAKIDFVEMSAESTGIVWEDFTAEDFVHPLPSGYEKIANTWYDAIKDTVVDIQNQKEKEAS